MVRTMPTFIFFKNGRRVGTVPGSDVIKVENTIEKLLPKRKIIDNTKHFIAVQTKVSVYLNLHIFLNSSEFWLKHLLNVNHLKAEYDEFMSNAVKVVLFFTSKSCESCKTLYPAVNQLAAKYKPNIVPIEVIQCWNTLCSFQNVWIKPQFFIAKLIFNYCFHLLLHRSMLMPKALSK